jgi:Spy/CpxP family protein refolding chaperone
MLSEKGRSAFGLAAASLLVATVAGAQPAGLAAQRGRGPRFDGPVRYLGLTEQQKSSFEKIHQQQQPEMKTLRDEMRDNDQKLRDALQAASPDPTTVGELAIEGHQLGEKMRALREQTDKQLRAILTPEQQVKFDAMMALRGDGGPVGRRPWRAPMGPPPMEGGAVPPPPRD